MEHIGVGSLPLVLIIAVFTGAVAAWQAAYQLKGIAPLSFLGAATSRAIITELGPVLTGIVIAGRVGASIAAELGTMKVTEQIDALESMAISPIRFLAMPRFLASIVMLPLLALFASFIAVFGAFVVSNYFLGVSPAVFFQSVKQHFLLYDLFTGLIKTVFFGGVTALIGVHNGLRTAGGAEGARRLAGSRPAAAPRCRARGPAERGCAGWRSRSGRAAACTPGPASRGHAAGPRGRTG